MTIQPQESLLPGPQTASHTVMITCCCPLNTQHIVYHPTDTELLQVTNDFLLAFDPGGLFVKNDQFSSLLLESANMQNKHVNLPRD